MRPNTQLVVCELSVFHVFSYMSGNQNKHKSCVRISSSAQLTNCSDVSHCCVLVQNADSIFLLYIYGKLTSYPSYPREVVWSKLCIFWAGQRRSIRFCWTSRTILVYSTGLSNYIGRISTLGGSERQQRPRKTNCYRLCCRYDHKLPYAMWHVWCWSNCSYEMQLFQFHCFPFISLLSNFSSYVAKRTLSSNEKKTTTNYNS